MQMGDVAKPDEEIANTSASDEASEETCSIDKANTNWDRLVTWQSVSSTFPGWERLITGQDLDEDLLPPIATDNPPTRMVSGGKTDEQLPSSVCSGTWPLDLKEGDVPKLTDCPLSSASPTWERLLTGETIDDDLVPPVAVKPSYTMAAGGRTDEEGWPPSLCSGLHNLDFKESPLGLHLNEITPSYVTEGTLSSAVSTMFGDASTSSGIKATPFASASPLAGLPTAPLAPNRFIEDTMGNLGAAGSDLLAALSSVSSSGGVSVAAQQALHLAASGFAGEVAPANGSVESGLVSQSQLDAHQQRTLEHDPDWATIHTVMVRNVPNKYTQQTLLEELHNANFQGAFDFLYLPMDTEKRANKGYAFVNFISPTFASAFRSLFDGRKLTRFRSKKQIVVKPAVLQGFEANYRHYSAARVSQGDPSARPLFLRAPSGEVEEEHTGSSRRRRRAGGGSAIDQAARRAAVASKGQGRGQAMTTAADTLHQKQILLAPLLQQCDSEEAPMWLDDAYAEASGAAPVAPSPPCNQRVFCPFCGTRFHVGDKYCRECGGDLRA